MTRPSNRTYRQDREGPRKPREKLLPKTGGKELCSWGSWVGTTDWLVRGSHPGALRVPRIGEIVAKLVPAEPIVSTGEVHPFLMWPDRRLRLVCEDGDETWIDADYWPVLRGLTLRRLDGTSSTRPINPDCRDLLAVGGFRNNRLVALVMPTLHDDGPLTVEDAE